MVRQVKVEIVADASKYTRGMRDAQKTTATFEDHTKRAGASLKAAFGAFSAGAAILEMRKWVAAARDSNRVTAQVNAVIASTHGAAGLSAKGFADLAKQIEKTAAVDDDIIAGGEAILATFTKVKAGGPDKVFERATQAAVDMAAALNHGQVTAEGLQSANLMLGKALQDPISGLTKLMRAGVSFSAQQKEQIADLVKHGQVAKAQGVILAEVNKEFGGSAAAAVTPAKRLATEWGDMQEVLGNLLIPAIDKGATILSTILGVVDRNRTAFGALFGVLGTGAAIIGGLVAASKIHKAVTEGIAVVTKTWEASQKGLNVVLGVTKVQAAAAAVAEGELAAATTGAGTAATGASAAMGRQGLSESTAAFARQGIAAVPILGALAGGFALSLKATKDNVSVFDELRHALGFGVEKLDKAKEASDRAAAAQAKLAVDAQAAGVAQGQLSGKTEVQARAMVDNAAKAKELGGQLQTLRGQFHQASDSVRDSILSYQGLIRQSKITAAEVIKDIRNQVANFAQYAKDTHRLIKAGVDPAAIRELSQKGPEYIHALATGSARQLQDYKATWVARNKEVKGDFAASMEAQYQGLVKKIRQMQRQIDSLTGKNIPVSASLRLNFTKDYTQAMWAADRARAGRMAEGGRVGGHGPRGQDNQLRWLAPDEHVWTGREVVAAGGHEAMERWRKAILAPGMALGGPVGRIDAQTSAVNKIEAFGTGTRLHAGIAAFLAAFGGAAAGFTGGAASGNVVRLALAQARRMAASFKVALALIEAGIVESGLRNLPYGDRDSLGFLQQRPSQGWLHPMNISYAAWDFLRRAIPIQGRYGTAGMLAQAVQRSAFPARYDAVQARALGILNAYGYDRGGLLPPGLSLAWNGTGRAEPVGGGDTYNFDFRGAVIADKQALVREVHQGIKDLQGRSGVPVSLRLKP